MVYGFVFDFRLCGCLLFVSVCKCLCLVWTCFDCVVLEGCYRGLGLGLHSLL